MNAESGKDTAFENVVMGGNVPRNYIPAVEKGFYEVLEKVTLSGNPIFGVRMVLRVPRGRLVRARVSSRYHWGIP